MYYLCVINDITLCILFKLRVSYEKKDAQLNILTRIYYIYLIGHCSVSWNQRTVRPVHSGENNQAKPDMVEIHTCTLSVLYHECSFFNHRYVH